MIVEISVAVIAAVEGSAHGAGTALAAACDRVVAADDATFATTFTNIGLAGDMGAFVSLPARIGAARTRQMLMLPTPISAAEALQLGLVDSVVEPGKALESSGISPADSTARSNSALAKAAALRSCRSRSATSETHRRPAGAFFDKPASVISGIVIDEGDSWM